MCLICRQRYVFAAGQTFLDFEISVADDEVANGQREVDLTFTAPNHPVVDATVNAIDDEVAGFEFTIPTINLVEGGGSQQSGLILTTQPASEIRLALTPSDDAQLTVSPSEVVFTPDNWNIVQTVTVDSLDDLTVEATRTLGVTASVASDTGPFASLESQTLSVLLEDDDIPRIVLEETDGSTIVDEFGSTDTFLLSLGAQPASDVTLIVDSTLVPNSRVVTRPTRLYTRQLGSAANSGCLDTIGF